MSEVVGETAKMALKHKFAKQAIGLVVGFATSQLVEKGYDAALKAYRAKAAAKQ